MAQHVSKRRKIDRQPLQKDADANAEQAASNNAPEKNSAKKASFRQDSRVAETTTGRSFRHSVDHSNLRYNHLMGRGARITSGKSSLMRLEIDELLSELESESQDCMAIVETELSKLRSVIEAIPAREALPADAIRRLETIENIRMPSPQLIPNGTINYTAAYDKPESIYVVGSYARKTAHLSNGIMTVDVCVTMPSHLFQKKDYLNYRYFQKRAYYLACLAAGIQKSKDCTFTLLFDFQHGNELQPILLVRPCQGKQKEHLTEPPLVFRILLAANEGLFPPEKTVPWKCCISDAAKKNLPNSTSAEPTPFYNATLRSESCALSYLAHFGHSSLQSEAFYGASMVGNVWLRQRGFGSALNDGGFGQFEWCLMISMLMKRGGYNGDTSSIQRHNNFQVFKAMLQFLAGRDLLSNPFFLNERNPEISPHGIPIFFDSVRGLNILFKMTEWSYKLLQHEASLSLQALSNPLVNDVESLFYRNISEPCLRFDSILRIPVSEVTSLTLRQKDNINPISSHCQDIYQVVKKGLGDRASLICIHYPKRAPSSVHSSYSSIESTGSLDVGLLLNAEQVHRTVDRGPYAEEKDTAAAFRTFWGEKAELRRFQDGSIQESLVWKGPESGSKPIEQIIRYVFQRHFKKPLSEVTKGIRNFFALSDQNRSHGARYSTLWDPAKEFRSFEKDIWAIEGLPLQIHQVSAASSELWQSQPSSSISGNHQYPKAPLDVNVQLEWSSRWPHDLNAALRTKIALLQKIGQSLKDFIPGQEVQLGLESEEDRFWSGAYLDITRPLGVRFHLRIHHDQQLSLLERMLKDADLGIRTKEELISSISKYKRSFIQAPLHAQAIKTLSTKFPFLLPTVRLMKRWRNSHLLSSHVRDELIEMITVRTFVHPHPWKTPASETTGFLRTLYFLGNWNWQTEPLIVDFNSSLEKEDIGSINKRFEAWRKLDPGMNRVAMFAGSDLDSSGIAWTEHQPSKVIAMRIKCLAESAYQMAQEHGLDIDPARMFTPSLKDYDFVIHLDEKFHFSDVSSSESVPQFKNLSTSRDDQQAQASANRGLLQPFIAELESLYGAYVMFFYDADVGSLIAGLWHPQTGPKPWKVSQASCTKPLVSGPEAGAQVEVNRTAILHGIARLGGDMVVNIEVK